MRLVFIGLTLSSSWGNGHATTYRALLRALSAAGHDCLFLECDRPWYAEHRDLRDPEYCRLAFYDDARGLARFAGAIDAADAVIVGSYVIDGAAVIRGLAARRRRRGLLAFYDIDTPVTLARLAAGDCRYLAPDAIPLLDLYLSFTGGPTLDVLERRWRARRARALYCAVDAAFYAPVSAPRRWDLGYLGTYSDDRQPMLERLLIEPARRAPARRFVVAGPQYPPDIVWPANVERIEHLAPVAHPSFYAAAGWTLNVTRAEMTRAGFSPSVRLFEATACAVPVVSDFWAGLDSIFAPGSELLIARTSEDVLAALARPERERLSIARAGQARTLRHHTATTRAAELIAHLHEAAARLPLAAAGD